MVVCVFCGNQEIPRSVAHVVPESLGGSGSPVGRPGVTCDGCNQYFGQKVESKALRSFPFSGYRVLAGIASKKGRMPFVQTTLGTIHGSGMPGLLELRPRTEDLAALVETGSVTRFRVLAEVTEPLAVCRMLLKIGLEQLGKYFYEVAISQRVAEARMFARQPKRGDTWWFALRSDPAEYLNTSEVGGSFESSIELIEHDGMLVSVMHMLGVSTMIPLQRGDVPPVQRDLPEPEYRTVVAVC